MISLKVQESGGRVQLLPVRRSVDQFLVYASLDGEVCLDKTSILVKARQVSLSESIGVLVSVGNVTKCLGR